MALEYRILGPLELRTADRVLPLGGRRQQTLLAVLLLNAGATVPFDRLIADLWNRPPPTARRQVINAAAAVRRAVEQGGGGPLVTLSHGYRLELAGDELDVETFAALHREAESAVAGGRTADAVGLLQNALDLWRGPVLTGLACESIEVSRQGLEEQRLTVSERLAELRLELGEVTSLIGWLVGLVAEHPARESLRATLMRALHRAGRSADALAVFAEGRRFLAEEFGTDPGAELRALHEQILRRDPASDRVDPAGPADASPARGPCFLPSGAPDFTGRQADLDRLAVLASSTAVGATTVVTVEGMGGVGKTALAVRAAHQMRDRYPDGQFFVDLRGFTEEEPRLRSDAALDVLLRQSGVPQDQIPVDHLARQDLWRAQMARRQVLIVLDNAADAAQVRPLLPASRGSLVLVTTRRQLLALEGAVPLPLDVLGAAEAAALFRRIVGPDRADAEPGAVREVVALCGGLPLAIRIAASRFRRRPTWTLAHLAEQLRDQRGLTAGDRSVTEVIALSYRHLSPANQRMFRLLGLAPGPDFDARAAAALAGTSVAEAASGLEELLECNLLVQDSRDRYRLHDLVRDCARNFAVEAHPDNDLHDARHRLFDYYLHLVDVRCRPFPMDRLLPQTNLLYPPEPLPTLSSPKEDMQCLDIEYDNLVAAAGYAIANGWNRHAWQLPCQMLPFLMRVGRRSGMLDMAHNALAATRELGDRHGESIALANLAVVLGEHGRPAEVPATLERAIEISRSLGDLAAVVARMRELGQFLLFQAGQLSEAATMFTEAREIARTLGDRSAEVNLTFSLAVAEGNLGRYESALEHLNHALVHYQHDGHTEAEAAVLINMAWMDQLRDRDDSAVVALERALRLCRAIGSIRGEARTLAWLAVAHRRLGRVPKSIEVGRSAVDTARRFHLTAEECDALNGLAEAYLAAGRCAEAEATFRNAERLARAGTLPMSVGRALEGLAHLAAVRGEPHRAKSLWEDALTSYPPGAIEAQDARMHLTALGVGSVQCMRCRVARPESPASGG